MKNSLRQNKSGFTLIEIIIVVIIVGVLASLAVPKFAAQIDSAKATEAYNMMGAFARSVDRCYSLVEETQNCDSWAELDMSAPDATRFTYTITAAANPGDPVVLRATLVGGAATDVITATMTPATSSKPALTGTGKFANIAGKI